MSVLDDPEIRELLREAWIDSQPGSGAPREQGGFILRGLNGKLLMERWPHGSLNRIFVPEHQGCRRGGLPIVATFHTHPNLGDDFQQEPSLTDIRAVQGDANLSADSYEGEYVISAEWIYRISKSGEVDVVGITSDLLGTM